MFHLLIYFKDSICIFILFYVHGFYFYFFIYFYFFLFLSDCQECWVLKVDYDFSCSVLVAYINESVYMVFLLQYLVTCEGHEIIFWAVLRPAYPMMADALCIVRALTRVCVFLKRSIPFEDKKNVCKSTFRPVYKHVSTFVLFWPTPIWTFDQYTALLYNN